MKMQSVMAAVTLFLLAGTAASAQVGDATSSPIGPTSPLAIGSPSIGPVGIPLGATELAAPGISPPPPPATGSMGCISSGSTSAAATAQFDGGGLATACATSGAGGSIDPTMPTPPALRAGRVGIPLGSTEIASPGLSPLPAPTSLLPPTLLATPTIVAAPSAMTAPPAPAEPPCPVMGTFSSQATLRGARQSASSAMTVSPGC
jgi:hypothetical protein